MCEECQELNALYSLVVDGGSVKIPERLQKVPNPPEGSLYILDELNTSAALFAKEFDERNMAKLDQLSLTADEATDVIVRLLSHEKLAISEFELLMKAATIARRNAIDIRPFLTHVDFGALTTAEKYAVIQYFDLSEEDHPYIWNR